jgi:ATP-binding cassette, subfamily B, multidrug efflux pump
MGATRRLAVFLTPYRRWAVLAPLLMVVEVAMDLLQPRLLQRIVDQGVAASDLAVVAGTGAWMVVTSTIGLAGGMGCAVFAVLAAQGFGADLRGGLFRKVQTLSFGNLDRLETGGLITRLTNDVTQTQELVMMLLRVMVRVPLLLVGGLLMAVLTSPQLALLFLLLIPAVLAMLVWIVNRTYPLFGRVQRRLDALNTVLQENLAGVRVVKAFARGDYERARFGVANESLRADNLAAVRASAVTMPLMMLTLNVGVVGAVWIGGLRVGAGGLEVGQLIAFVNYLTLTLMSLLMVGMLVLRLSRAAASAERIYQVLDSEPEVRQRPDAVPLPAPGGRVAFEGVDFSYRSDGRDAVLKGLSFVAEPGETVALLGATGAGKSSLVHLIPRFYDVSGGRVTLDGMDVRELAEASLRGAVGVALQESILFSGTIRDNIRYGRPEASEAEVIAAAELAQAHDFIVRLPRGYDSVVGQRGVNLSGGQKQRVAIARALLTAPAVLLLDDSTSAVDVETEARLQAALARHRPEQTRIVVAQRISTVLGADRILVLDDGRIVAQGTHESLLASSPIYREIYESQLEHGAVTHGDG